MVLPFVTLDLMWNNENADTGIESILFFVSAVIGIIKQLCIAVNQKKLGININAAIDDWLSAKDDEETRKIMKKYAIKARILTFILLYSACGCFCIYISAIVFINLKQIFFTDSLDGKIHLYIYQSITDSYWHNFLNSVVYYDVLYMQNNVIVAFCILMTCS